jgi:hypothetical protein
MTLDSDSGVTPGYPRRTGVTCRSAGWRRPANESLAVSPHRVTPTRSGTASWRYCGSGSALLAALHTVNVRLSVFLDAGSGWARVDAVVDLHFQPGTRPACSIHVCISGPCASSRVFTLT